MAYKSAFTGAKIDELLSYIQEIKTTPSTILVNMTEKNILDKLTAQGIIDKINTVSGSIVFTKYVDARGGAGKTT